MRTYRIGSATVKDTGLTLEISGTLCVRLHHADERQPKRMAIPGAFLSRVLPVVTDSVPTGVEIPTIGFVRREGVSANVLGVFNGPRTGSKVIL